jgi:hypothetical protein
MTGSENDFLEKRYRKLSDGAAPLQEQHANAKWRASRNAKRLNQMASRPDSSLPKA